MKTEPLISNELRSSTAEPYLRWIIRAFDSWEDGVGVIRGQKNSKADWKDLKIAIINAKAFIEVLDKNK